MDSSLCRLRRRQNEHGASSKWYEHEGLTVHDFRRSALSNITEAGVSVPDAMSISGHKTVSTFLRYNIVSKQRKRDTMRKVEDMAAAKRKSPRTKGHLARRV